MGIWPAFVRFLIIFSEFAAHVAAQSAAHALDWTRLVC